jgi:succinate dehydrogenase/fumarate reductase cytochrome b subunit
VLVGLPLALHALFGLVLWRRRAAAPGAGSSARALLAAHRISGIVVALFLVDHFVRFRLPILRGELRPADSVQRLAAELSRTQAGFPWIAGLSLLGVIAVSFHLGYGLRRIAERSPELAANRTYSAVSLGVGLVVLFAGLFSLLRLAAG